MKSSIDTSISSARVTEVTGLRLLASLTLLPLRRCGALD
jgi:hypothetical protein